MDDSDGESSGSPRAITSFLRQHDFPCARCGYSLRALPEPRCPECGHITDLREWLIANPPPTHTGRALGVGFLLGLLLSICALPYTGEGDGSYLLIFLIAGASYFGAPVLFALYGLTIALTRKSAHGVAGLLGVLCFHGVLLAVSLPVYRVSFRISPEPWALLAIWRREPLEAAFVIALFAIGLILASYFGLSRRSYFRIRRLLTRST